MDLIRTFIESAFVHYPISEKSEDCRLPIKENVFVEITKKRHLELSDDHIRLLYKLYLYEWSKGNAEPNIFYALLPFTNPKSRNITINRFQVAGTSSVLSLS